MRNKKLTKEKKLKIIIKEQQRMIEVLSNREIVRGLKNALEDFKKGRYTILAK